MTFIPAERFNLSDYLLDDRVREGRGGRTALRLPDREMTYAEVQALANRFGKVLLAQGVQPEQRVMIALPDGAEFAGALFGVLKIGAVGVMVNPALSPAELARLFEYTRARLAVVDATVLPAFAEAAAQAEISPGFLTVGGSGGAGGLTPPSFEEESARASRADNRLDNARTHRDDPAIWLFSGGTTGRPKAVVQTHTS